MDYIVSIHMAKELSRFEMEQCQASSVRVAAVDQEAATQELSRGPACWKGSERQPSNERLILKSGTQPAQRIAGSHY
jgi:hypothetical protein